MMNVLQASVLGLVEGLTEFLPISSTFHLIWVTRLLGLAQTEYQKSFEVIIQAGAILAVAVLYAKTVWRNTALLKNLLVSFVPTAVVGFVLYKVIKGFFFENYGLQLVVFAVVGVLFVLFERWQNDRSLDREIVTMTYSEAALVGLVQAAAVVPGVSRAGAVLLILMYLRFTRKEAAIYSFLLAFPTIGAAGVLDIYQSRAELMSGDFPIGFVVIGFIAAFISAVVVIRWFIRYLQHHTLESFGWYRLVLVALLLLLFYR